jgi:hypothetical protein
MNLKVTLNADRFVRTTTAFPKVCAASATTQTPKLIPTKTQMVATGKAPKELDMVP